MDQQQGTRVRGRRQLGGTEACSVTGETPDLHRSPTGLGLHAHVIKPPKNKVGSDEARSVWIPAAQS